MDNIIPCLIALALVAAMAPAVRPQARARVVVRRK